MKLINIINAEGGPNTWGDNMKECKIHGKIVYFKLNELTNDCYHFYDSLLKDENNYYISTIKEIIPSHMYYGETTGYEVKCEEYNSSGSINNTGNYISNSIKPKIGDEYYYIVRKFYDYDNYIMQYSKKITPEWESLDNCKDNIIDKVNNTSVKEENIKLKYNFGNYNLYSGIIIGIFITIISIFVYKKFYINYKK